MRERKLLRRTAVFALLLAMLAALTLGGSTYAWFTFRAHTRITPLGGTISRGSGDLLIAATRNGPFDVQCALPLSDPDATLLPLSTADLQNFFAVRLQDGDGMAQTYAAAAQRAQQNTLHGTVYLKAEGGAFDVYFDPRGVYCGTDNQALAAMRLGLRIQTQAGVRVHIFTLDALGQTGEAASVPTVPQSNTVVQSIDAQGLPTYVNDPAVRISAAMAQGSAEAPTAGQQMLCHLAAEEIAAVQFWLYLEGCDEHCCNSVQGRDIALQLGFAGVGGAQ